MAKRDILFKQFGPKLLEAVLRMILSELNIIRSETGLPDRTEEQVFDQITNHYGDLTDYDWMSVE